MPQFEDTDIQDIKRDSFNHKIVYKSIGNQRKKGPRVPMVHRIGAPHSNKSKATNRQKPRKR